MNANEDEIAVLMTERELFEQFLAMRTSSGCPEETVATEIMGDLEYSASGRALVAAILNGLRKHVSPSYELGETVVELNLMVSAFTEAQQWFEKYRLERAVRLGPAGPTPLGKDSGLRYLPAPLAGGPTT